MKDLPDFNDSDLSNNKNLVLSRIDVENYICDPILMHVIKETSRKMQKPLNQVRVMDFGCGNGMLVASLRENDFDAYGVDINALYIENGRKYFGKKGVNLLKSIDIEGGADFPDGSFDVVYSNQVLEHVRDLDSFLKEIRRLMSPLATSLHVFPASLTPIEVHLKLPLVHWLPKGKIQHNAIRVFLQLGFGAQYFTNLPLQDRASIFAKYARNNVYYRSSKEMFRQFRKFGLDATHIERQALTLSKGRSARLAAIPFVGHLGAFMYRIFVSRYILVRKLNEM